MITALFCSNSGCEPLEKDSNSAVAKQQEKLMQESNSQLGLPNIQNFQEKKIMKMILEERDRADLLCYAYITNMHGNLIFLGRCIGYGLPYSTQYTNPIKTVDYLFEGNIEQLPQADPNGLFMPTGLSATWLLMIDPKTNEQKVVYIEPEIIVSPFKLH